MHELKAVGWTTATRLSLSADLGRQPRSRQQPDEMSFQSSLRHFVMDFPLTRDACFQGSDRSSSRFGPVVILNAVDDTV